MRSFRARSGPTGEQLFFSLDEIERICLDALEAVGLLPTAPAPVVIDRFIEKRFKLSPSYEDLPEGVLGVTRFSTKGVEAIVVARALDEEGGTTNERRARTTLAHEAGHGLLHTSLFAGLDLTPPMFADLSDVDRPKVLCREPDAPGAAKGRYTGQWWEFQANQAMAALLLPRPLVAKAAEPFLVPQGTFGVTLPNDRRDRAARLLADTFDVNPVVVRLRLDALFPVHTTDQLSL